MDDEKLRKLSKSQFDLVEKIAKEAERQGVNPALAIAIAEAETGGKFSHFSGDKVLTSPAGARGVMQIMPDTARLYNKNLGADIDPDDEDSNIRGGVFILKDLLTKYKSPRNAVAMYNASPKANAEFLKLYQTDPDKAIMSLRPETHNYSLRVSKNFNLDDDNETGLIEPTKEKGAFEGYESESSKFKREQEEAAKDAPPAANPEDKQGGIDAREAGALVGAGVNLLGPMYSNPEISPKIDTSRAKERALESQDKLDIARQQFESALPNGPEHLEDQFAWSQQELERLKNEKRLAQERLKTFPKTAPEAPAVEMPTSPVVEAPSRTKAGDPGAVNWVHSMAEGVPEVVANQALNMRADNPRGGQAIIDADMAARQRQADLGLSDYGLARTEGGVQLALPPTTVAERQADEERRSSENQAEIERKTQEARLQQEAQARQMEQQRAAHEAELARVNQELAQHGQAHNTLTQQRRSTTPVQRALTKAEADAEVARRRLARAENQPGPLSRAAELVGVKSAKANPLVRPIVGGLAGYAGVMSYQEALERAKAGDTSEAVLKALEAGSVAAMLAPPVNPKMTRLRGAGKIGAIGTGTYELGRRLLRDRPPEE